jgi:hypothetical protein
MSRPPKLHYIRPQDSLHATEHRIDGRQPADKKHTSPNRPPDNLLQRQRNCVNRNGHVRCTLHQEHCGGEQSAVEPEAVFQIFVNRKDSKSCEKRDKQNSDDDRNDGVQKGRHGIAQVLVVRP